MPKLKYTGRETVDAGSLRWSENEVRDVSQEYFDTWITNHEFIEVKDVSEKIEQEQKEEIKIKVKKGKISNA